MTTHLGKVALPTRGVAPDPAPCGGGPPRPGRREVPPVAAPPARIARRKGARLSAALLLGVDTAAFAAAMAMTGTTGVKTLTVLVLVVALFSGGDLYRARLSLSVLDDAPAIVVRALAAGAGAMVLGGLGDGLAGTARLRTAAVFAVLCLAGRSLAYAGVRTARRHHRLQQRALLLGAGTVAGVPGGQPARPPRVRPAPGGDARRRPAALPRGAARTHPGRVRRPQPRPGRAGRRRRHRHLRPGAGAVGRGHAPGLRPPVLRDLLRPPALRAAHRHPGHRGPLGRAVGPPAPGAVPHRQPGRASGSATSRSRPSRWCCSRRSWPSARC